MKADKELNIELYKEMYMIRATEKQIQEYYHEDEMKTPMHMSMGAEAINAGLCAALNKNDQVFGTYRSHALYLAKTGNIYNFFAEMYGKNTALLKGKGGSMHLCDPQKGFMGTSAIVASSISVGVGAAFANKIKGNGKVVAVFFGDGATDEGTFWESINVASLMSIPVIFVCEDNDLAVHTHTRQRKGHQDITKIISKFNCNVFKDDSTDVERIYYLAKKAIKLTRSTNTPCFMHLKYYRYLEHVGINEDFDAGYRCRNEFERWFKKDPIMLQRIKLGKIGIREEMIKEEERKIENKIDAVMNRVKLEPFAKNDELYEEVFE